MIEPKLIRALLVPQKWRLLDQGQGKKGPKIATFKFPKNRKGNFDFGGMESPQT